MLIANLIFALCTLASRSYSCYPPVVVAAIYHPSGDLSTEQTVDQSVDLAIARVLVAVSSSTPSYSPSNLFKSCNKLFAVLCKNNGGPSEFTYSSIRSKVRLQLASGG